MTTQLPFLELNLLDSVSEHLHSYDIFHYKGDKMILFETHLFGRFLHRIEIDLHTAEYVVTISKADKTEQKKIFSEAQDVASFVKILLNK